MQQEDSSDRAILTKKEVIVRGLKNMFEMLLEKLEEPNCAGHENTEALICLIRKTLQNDDELESLGVNLFRSFIKLYPYLEGVFSHHCLNESQSVEEAGSRLQAIAKVMKGGGEEAGPALRVIARTLSSIAVDEEKQVLGSTGSEDVKGYRNKVGRRLLKAGLMYPAGLAPMTNYIGVVYLLTDDQLKDISVHVTNLVEYFISLRNQLN